MLANRTQIPAAGTCCTSPAAGCNRLAPGQTICTTSDNVTLSVDKLVNTVLFAFDDADDDGVADEVDHCPHTVLAGPDPATRPGRLDDSTTILGCNRSQILACKPGKNVGETKHGLIARMREP